MEHFSEVVLGSGFLMMIPVLATMNKSQIEEFRQLVGEGKLKIL